MPSCAVLRAVAAHLLQLLLEPLDTLADEPPVRLYLRLAGAPRTDAASEALQVAPLACQTRQEVLRLRQFHLQAPLVRPRMPCEHIQDERGAVDDLHVLAEGALEVLLLCGGQFVVTDQGAETDSVARVRDLLQLALADVRVGRRFQLLGNRSGHLCACGVGQLGEFVEGIGDRPGRASALDAHAYEQRLLRRLGCFHRSRLPCYG